MFVDEVFRYGQEHMGQGGMTSFFQQYFFILVLLLVIPLLIIAYRLLFPDLNKIHSTQIEAQRVPEDVEPPDRPDDRDGEEPGEPIKMEGEKPDAVAIALRLLQPDERKVVEI